jgi:ABC-type multidrug transport system fused ATPase/permease subunit
MFVLGFIFGSRLLDVAESWWIKKWVQSNEEALSIPLNVTMGLASIAHRIHYTFKETSTSASLLDPHLPDSVSNTNFFQAFISKGEDSLNMYLTVYILITTSNILIGASRWASLYYGTLRASRKLYQILLHRIMHAPMRFFDVTPLGRILNRFSKDFEYVDSSVPNDIMYFAIQWLIIISAVLTVCAVFPIFFIPMLFVTFLNIQIGKRFSSASRELRRMDSVTRSPLFTHFGETIVGIVTIRAYGATRQFLEEMLRKVDENARPFYLLWIANRWCGTRFSFLGAAVNFCTGCFILSSLDYIDASLAGFCLSFVLSYTSQVLFLFSFFVIFSS